MKANALSQRIARKKLERDVDGIISGIDTESRNELNSDMVGKFLQIVGVYKVLYNENYGDYSLNTSEVSSEMVSHKETVLLRRDLERNFHSGFWNLLSNYSHTSVNSHLFKEVILLLFDVNTMQLDTLAEYIESNINHHIDIIASYNSQEDVNDNLQTKLNKYSLQGRKKKSLSWREVIRDFKRLGGTNLHTAVDSWLRYKKLDKLKPPSWAFTPAVDKNSRALDKAHIKSYLERSFQCGSRDVAGICFVRVDDFNIDNDSIEEGYVVPERSRSNGPSISFSVTTRREERARHKHTNPRNGRQEKAQCREAGANAAPQAAATSRSLHIRTIHQ